MLQVVLPVALIRVPIGKGVGALAMALATLEVARVEVPTCPHGDPVAIFHSGGSFAILKINSQNVPDARMLDVSKQPALRDTLHFRQTSFRLGPLSEHLGIACHDQA